MTYPFDPYGRRGQHRQSPAPGTVNLADFQKCKRSPEIGPPPGQGAGEDKQLGGEVDRPGEGSASQNAGTRIKNEALHAERAPKKQMDRLGLCQRAALEMSEPGSRK